jgi:hypothetical protein
VWTNFKKVCDNIKTIAKVQWQEGNGEDKLVCAAPREQESKLLKTRMPRARLRLDRVGKVSDVMEIVKELHSPVVAVKRTTTKR